jgi:hypothetical protein
MQEPLVIFSAYQDLIIESYLRSRYRGWMPLPWHVVQVKEPIPSQLMHLETSFSSPPSSTVTEPVPRQNLHFSAESNPITKSNHQNFKFSTWQYISYHHPNSVMPPVSCHFVFLAEKWHSYNIYSLISSNSPSLLL